MRATPVRLGLVAAALFLLQADAALGNTASCYSQQVPQANTGGDELFFSSSSAPPNVMVLLDTSGSMNHFPQCDGLAVRATASAGNPTVNWGEAGCQPTLANGAGGCNEAWMNAFDTTGSTTVDPYDPGDPSASPYLTDAPTWKKGCTAANCGLFKPDKYYRYGEWDGDSAVERTGTGTTSLAACEGVPALSGTSCSSCLGSKGYFVWKSSTGAQAAVFSGSWLNKNPPKYVVARKVIKDLVKMTASDASLDGVRFGLATFNSGGNGAKVVVPLGPDCDHAVSATGIDKAQYQPVRQKLFDALNDPTQVVIGGSTPLADALYDLGQYMSGGRAWNGIGNMTQRGSGTALTDTDPGSMNVSWGGTNRSICWSCQTSIIVIVTDGAPKFDNAAEPAPDSVNNFPTTSDPDYITAAHCGSTGTQCNTDDSPAVLSKLPLVAKFLKTNDLRSYANTNGIQSVTTYTISFGIPSTNTTALHILQSTADMGGATPNGFSNTSSGAQLSAALNQAASAAAQEADSFSASRASTLQTNTGGASLSETYLARFNPSDGKQKFWQGHLLQARLFDEFASGCDPTLANADQPQVTCGSKSVSANLNGDIDPNTNKSRCSGVFLVDQNCDPIFEDPTNGNLKKGAFDASGAVVKLTGASAGDPSFFWDAATQLASISSQAPASGDTPSNNPSARFIYTVVDTDNNGSLDGLTQVIPANAATLAKYMDLSPAWCTTLYTALALPIPSPWTSTDIAYCAEQVIWFVRGVDVMDFDGDNCAGPANAPSPGSGKPVSTRPNVTKDATTGKGCVDVTKGEERVIGNDNSGLNRFGKLGDIFHSIPVAVKPPVAPFICDLNAETQCLGTIHGMKTASSGATTPQDDYSGKTAYEAYRSDKIDRDRIVLAGANDGMLHAFHAGSGTGSTRDLFGSLPYDAGNGKEIWAFIPPDLLPRLKDMLFHHTYFVDGSPMVRDIWYDSNGDHRKQKTEFHTVAIVGERGGGINYTALDVTDPYNPQFLWTFPPPRSSERLLAGQSWSDFGGRPPPIGPVRLHIDGCTPSATDPCTEERWVVMLGGGFDPTLMRGRRVWMVDAWTGALLWRWADEDFQANVKASGLTSSMFPVAAAPGMLDIGSSAAGAGVVDSDGFFDTATWGDLGGNLWVARFYDAGVVDSGTHLVNNWWAARAFEQRRDSSLQPAAGRSEFFQMTGNTITTDDQHLRTFLGGGNRARLLDVGNHCSADDLLGCCRASCSTVSASLAQDDGTGQCSVTGSASCTSTGGIVLGQPSIGGTCDPRGTTGSCGGFDSTASVSLQCGTNASSTPSAVTTCVEDTTLLTSYCTAEAAPSIASQGVTGNAPRTRFYAVWSYGGSTARQFSTQTQAQTFDTQRFTDVTFTNTGPGTCSGVSCTLADVTAGTAASSTGPGWFYQHGDVCPVEGCGTAPFVAPWENEKTATGGIPDTQGCVSWRTIRPTTSAGDPCVRAFGSPVALTYMSDLAFGTVTSACAIKGGTSGTVNYRAVKRDSVAPPTERLSRISVNSRGEVQRSTMTFDQGQPLIQGTNVRRSLVEPSSWMEVDRDLHTCRHGDGSTCE